MWEEEQLLAGAYFSQLAIDGQYPLGRLCRRINCILTKNIQNPYEPPTCARINDGFFRQMDPFGNVSSALGFRWVTLSLEPLNLMNLH